MGMLKGLKVRDCSRSRSGERTVGADEGSEEEEGCCCSSERGSSESSGWEERGGGRGRVVGGFWAGMGWALEVGREVSDGGGREGGRRGGGGCRFEDVVARDDGLEREGGAREDESVREVTGVEWKDREVGGGGGGGRQQEERERRSLDRLCSRMDLISGSDRRGANMSD